MPEKRTLILLIGVLLASALAPLGSTSIAVAMPQIAEFMNMDPGTTTQLLVGGYLLISVIGQAPAGKLGDIIGYQKALYAGLVIFAAGSLLAFLVRTIEVLLLSRMMMAAASAMIVPNASAMLRTQLPEDILPFAYGVFGATMGAAAAVGPLLGGALTHLFGWPAIFLANVPWVLVAGALIVLTSSRQTEKRSGRLDLWASLLLAVSIAALQLAFLDGSISVAFLLPGLALLALFLWLQLRSTNPVFNPRFFRQPAYLGAGISISLSNFTMYALLFQLPIFFSDIRPAPEIEIASALTAMTLFMMIGGPMAGFAGRHFGIRYTALLSSLIYLLGLFLIRDMGSVEAPSDILVAMALMGFAGGMSGPVVQSAGMLAIDKRDAGMAAGGLSTLRYFGGTLGISVLSLQLSTASVTTLPQHNSVLPFYASAMVVVLMASFLLPLKKNHPR